MAKIASVIIILVLLFPAVTMAAGFGLNINNNGFSFGINTGSGGAGGGGWNAGALAGTGLPSGSIIGIIEGIMFWLLGLLGLFGVIGFVIAGIIYLVSAGDETTLERAKSAMKWSLVGVVVGLLGVVIIQAVNLMLNASSGF